MSSLSDPIYLRIHQLVTEWLEGEDSDRVHAELNDLLNSNERAVSIYQQYTQESAGLRWQAMDSERARREIELLLPQSQYQPCKPGGTGPDDHEPTSTFAKFVLAASVLVLAGIAYQLFSNRDQHSLHIAEVQTQEGNLLTDDEGSGSAITSELTAESGNNNKLNGEIATLTRLIQTHWRAETDARDALSRLRAGEEIWLESGQAEILFDSGVEVVLTGPAHLKVQSNMSASVEYGTFSARVGPRGKGFTIQTPSAEVVDLGTEFGLAVNRAGETEVAVFSGIVDLSYDDPSPEISTARQRLNQGEALRVGLNGQTQRVVLIDSERFPMAGSQWVSRSKTGSVIESVSDNLRSSHSRSFYRIVRGGFGEDAAAFVDRGHQWNGISESGIPEFLLGADYVMPFNDDKLQDTLAVTVVLAKPAIVYLLFDNNMSRPDWLTSHFVDTNFDIGLDQDASKYRPLKHVGVGPAESIDDTFSIWRREVPEAGPVMLGGVSAPEDKERGYNMYGIVAVPMIMQTVDGTPTDR